MDDAERGSNAILSIDLEAQEITGPDGGSIRFDIDPGRRHIMLEGLDDIASTLKSDAAISTFENNNRAARPWL